MSVYAATPTDEAYKTFKKFCNDLRCPLCGSRLDGNIHAKEARLHCVLNNAEYSCRWYPDSNLPQGETIRYWYPVYEYTINIAKIGDSFQTTIDRFDADAVEFYKAQTRKRIFHYIGERFPFCNQRMEEDRFLKKLRTIKVFL